MVTLFINQTGALQRVKVAMTNNCAWRTGNVTILGKLGGIVPSLRAVGFEWKKGQHNENIT